RVDECLRLAEDRVEIGDIDLLGYFDLIVRRSVPGPDRGLVVWQEFRGHARDLDQERFALVQFDLQPARLAQADPGRHSTETSIDLGEKRLAGLYLCDRDVARRAVEPFCYLDCSGAAGPQLGDLSAQAGQERAGDLAEVHHLAGIERCTLVADYDGVDPL